MMKASGPRFGEVFFVSFPPADPPGREQTGYRPAIAVGYPHLAGAPRFPMLVLVPLTTRLGAWSAASPDLYPVLSAGAGGISRDSVALLDQIRSVDIARIHRSIGQLDEPAIAAIRRGLARIFALPRPL